MEKISKISIVFLVSFQLTLGGSISSLAVAQEKSINIDEYKQKLKEFKEKLLGKEVNTCIEENQQVDDNLKDYSEENSIDVKEQKLDNLVEKSFENYEDHTCNYYTLPQKKDNKEPSCQNKKIPGILNKVAEKIIKYEKDKKAPPIFRLDDPQLKVLRKEAQGHLSILKKYLTYDIEPYVKYEILMHYLDSVALPMRDFITINKSYIGGESDASSFYTSLLPDVPPYLTQDESMKRGLSLGIDPTTAPFGLKVEDSIWGNSKLNYDPNAILQRDMMTLLKAPTKRNYLTSLRWMSMHMMFSQMQIYNTIGKLKSKITIPNSCMKHLPKNTPNTMEFDMPKGTGEKFIENILSENALIVDPQEGAYYEYYLYNIDKDPTAAGYSGLAPFEKYHYAKKSQNSGFLHSQPDIDDFTFFDRIIAIKLNTIKSKAYRKSYNQTAPRGNHFMGSTTKEDFEDFEILKQIVTPAAQPQGIFTKANQYKITKDGEEIELDVEWLNLSEYLAKLMVKNNTLDYMELMSNNLKSQLEQNTIKIDMPSLYGSSVWRHWALNNLLEFIKSKSLETISKNSRIGLAIRQACHSSPSICANGVNEPNQVLLNVIKKLEYIVFNHDYIPIRRLKEKNLEEDYKFLKKLWSNFRDYTNEFDFAKPSELDFILSQMDVGNPWARTRLSYLIAVDQFENNKNNCNPTLVNRMKNRLQEAAGMLKIKNPISINHGNNLLSKNEKKALWNDIYQEINENSSSLFSYKDEKDKPYYNYIEDISYNTFLTKEDVLKYLEKNISEEIDVEDLDKIDNISSSDLGQHGKYLKAIYLERNNIDEQIRLFKNYVEEMKLPENIQTKVVFLSLDNEYKKVLYTILLKTAARNKKEDVYQSLNNFCELDTNDEEGLKTMFYSSTKSQNHLNKIAGLPSVPENVMDAVMSFSEELGDIPYALGSVGLIISAIVISSVCVASVGTLCSVAAVALPFLAASGMGLQLKLADRVTKRKVRSLTNQEHVKAMEEIGLADVDSNEEVSYSWGWVALESLFVIPFLNATARAISTGTRVVARTAKTGRLLSKSSNALREVEIEYSLNALKLNRTTSKSIVSSEINKVNKIRYLVNTNQLPKSKLIEKMGYLLKKTKTTISSRISSKLNNSTLSTLKPLEIDKQTAKIVSKHFNNDPKQMRRFISSYTKRIKKAKTTMRNIKAYEATKKAGGKSSIYKNIIYGIKKMIYSNIDEHSSTLLKIEKDLIKGAKNPNFKLERYVADNIEDFTSFFVNTNIRLKEAPHFITFLGGIPTGGLIKGARTPGLGIFSDGTLMRRYFTSRSRLVYETHKIVAQSTLGIRENARGIKTISIFRAFSQSVSQLQKESPKEVAKNISKKYAMLEKNMAAQSYEQFKILINNKKFSNKLPKEILNIDQARLRGILFNPSSPYEKAVGDTIWGAIDGESILNISIKEQKDILFFINKFSSYKTTNEFNRLVNAMKVLLIKQNPSTLEIM